MTTTYLTRAQVAEHYPISVHTLAKLASNGKGPRFYKPTDKCLYRPADVEAWIEASVVLPTAHASLSASRSETARPPGNRGRARPDVAPAGRSGLKSLPPSPNSWLLRKD